MTIGMPMYDLCVLFIESSTAAKLTSGPEDIADS